MILKRISILNYKNLEQVELSFSPKLNCFFGQNGMGKTNLLDAVYFLSFCKSAGNPIDSQNIRHDADFFVIQGFYEAADGTPEEIYCGMKRRQKKQFKRNKKEYTRLSDHIGFLPLVMVSPADSELIAGGSDERRRFMDVVISQYDKEYLDALIRYNKALVQRNTLLKSEQPVEEELFLVWEEMMAQAGEVVFRKREAFIREFIPIFQSFYSFISQDREKVGLSYDSHARDASIYRCDAGRGASRRETGRFMSRRLAPWQAAQRRAGLGEHRRCTGRGLGSDAEYRSALRIDPRRRPLILLFVLDLMLLGRCSVDDLSLALGLHARLS